MASCNPVADYGCSSDKRKPYRSTGLLRIGRYRYASGCLLPCFTLVESNSRPLRGTLGLHKHHFRLSDHRSLFRSLVHRPDLPRASKPRRPAEFLAVCVWLRLRCRRLSYTLRRLVVYRSHGSRQRRYQLERPRLARCAQRTRTGRGGVRRACVPMASGRNYGYSRK